MATEANMKKTVPSDPNAKTVTETIEPHEKNYKTLTTDILFLLAGTIIGSFGSVCILVPNGLTTGGLAGTARILQAVIPGLDYGVMFGVLTALTLVAVFVFLGKKEAKKVALLAVMYPLVTLLVEEIDFQLLEEKDLFLAAIYYGACSGACSGLILARGYSICAVDAIAKIVKKYFVKNAPLSKIILVLNSAVILVSAFFYGINVALYALIAQVVVAKVIDIIIFGLQSHIVEVKIIMADYAPVQDYILHTLGRGVSISHIVGAYTMKSHDQLLTYCSPRESVLIRQLVAKTDPHAFVTVIKVDTVWGQGAGFSNLLKPDSEN